MTIEVVPSPVIAPGGPRVGVASSVLHVPKARPGIETQRDEGMSQIVRVEALAFWSAPIAGLAFRATARLQLDPTEHRSR